MTLDFGLVKLVSKLSNQWDVVGSKEIFSTFSAGRSLLMAARIKSRKFLDGTRWVKEESEVNWSSVLRL